MLVDRAIVNAQIQAYQPPIVAPFPQGFRGGLVLGESATDQKLRHTRYWRPVDSFDADRSHHETLDGEYIFAGPIYNHFGHFMAEMIHRVVPSKRKFDKHPWLFVTDIDAPESVVQESLPKMCLDVLSFLEIPPEKIEVVSRNKIVHRVLICEQGSDLGGGPKPGYLDDLRVFTERRIGPLHQDDPAISKVYVSRSALSGGGFLGEGYLEELLVGEGYTIFRPERHSVSRQMDVYRKSDIVIFPEGSAAHGVELLGSGMLKTCALLVRRTDHQLLFERVLEPRARRFHSLNASVVLGTIFADRARGVPIEDLGVAVIDIGQLRSFLRRFGLARLASFDPSVYIAALQKDVVKYIEFGVNQQPDWVDKSRIRSLLAALDAEIAKVSRRPYGVGAVYSV